MATVCHYCNQTFIGGSHRYDFRITNYVSLVAEAMGIYLEDKFNKFAQWGDLNRILQDASGPIGESSFDKDRIVEVFKAVFVKEESCAR